MPATTYCKRKCNMLLAAFLVATPLAADDAGEGKGRLFRFGMQATIAHPTIDNDGYSSIVAGSSIFLENAWTKTWGCRLRLGEIAFEGKGKEKFPYRTLMAELIRRFSSNYAGGYLFGGFGIAPKLPNSNSPKWHLDTWSEGDNIARALSGGYGYNLNQWLGAEIRYTIHRPYYHFCDERKKMGFNNQR